MFRRWRERRRRARRATSGRRAAPPRRQRPKVAPLDDLGREIQAVLAEDLRSGAKLMQPQYRGGGGSAFNGYCAVASGAYFFLGGGREAGLQPMQLTGDDFSHWWLETDDGRTAIDLTLGQDEKQGDFRYEDGGPRGFMMTGYKRPSQRAQVVIDRVLEARRRGGQDDS